LVDNLGISLRLIRLHAFGDGAATVGTYSAAGKKYAAMRFAYCALRGVMGAVALVVTPAPATEHPSLPAEIPDIYRILAMAFHDMA
jgi:hypothetical protein